MITLDRLKYFTAVAHFQHVGKAAAQLSISPSVISAAIKVLEEELGCALFLRENQRIKLTSQGELLLEKANAILEDTKKLYVDFSSKAVELKGHYKIGGSHFLMQEFLIPSYLKLYGKHPKISADLMSLDSAVAISKVQAGELDMAFIFRSSYQSKLEEEILLENSFQICVKKNHPILKLNKQKDIIEKLNTLPAVTFRSSANLAGLDFWENHPSFNTVGITPKHTFFYEDTQTALQLLSKTNGWAYMPEIVVKTNKSLSMVKLKSKLIAPVNISIVWNDRKPLGGFLKMLKDELKSIVGEI